MPVPEPARELARRLAPGYISDRARRFEREQRDREGSTELARRLAGRDWATVRAGPVRNLRYPTGRLGEIDAAAAKLLGTYEQELHAVFRRALAGSPSRFVDVGCADGYFAAGLAVAAPGLRVHAFDLAASARELCAAVATANGVADRVQVGRRFRPGSLPDVDLHRALLLCDIEGGERALFRPELVGRLGTASVVIEVHEFAAPGTQAALDAVFEASHRRELLRQSPRSDPPEEIAGWTEAERRLALDEHRPPELHWASYTPRKEGRE